MKRQRERLAAENNACHIEGSPFHGKEEERLNGPHQANSRSLTRLKGDGILFGSAQGRRDDTFLLRSE
jgi:hypothetical protein